MHNFWNYHSFLFVFFMFFFPRLTMLFATTTGGGLLYWLGWLFAPRFTVAIIATILFYQNNEILLIFTWIWALFGETTEKVIIKTRTTKSSGEIYCVEKN